MSDIKFIIPESFEVKSAQRTYPVEFSDTVEGIVEKLQQIKNPVFIIDKNIYRLYRIQLDNAVKNNPILQIEATEDAKTFEGVGAVINWFSEKKVTKGNHVIAIGGGIIQDIATFSTCVFFRGLPWTLVPTTLLSMSDSCIGAKCGISLNNIKNQLGVFNSPYAVLITPAFLSTLAPIDVKSGYGEILKLYLTAGYFKFLELDQELDQSKTLLSAQTGKHIAESLIIKKKVIEADEYEVHLRMILNYGHTFGHALEANTHHFVPHGLGVVWGIDFENFISQRSGWLEPEKYAKINRFIQQHLSFENTKAVTADGLLDASRRDKKMTSASEINMIYFTDRDELEIKKTKLDDKFKVLLVEYLEKHDVFHRH